MRRIHFGNDDLCRVRIVTTFGPFVEMLFALAQVNDTGKVFHDWGRRVRRQLGARMDVVAALAGAQTSDLLALLGSGMPDTGKWPLGTGLSADQAVGALRDFYRVGLAPYWHSVRGHLEREREARARVMVTGGVERLLATLHSRFRWKAPVLELPSETPEEIHLGGRGLVLVPSMFLSPRTGVVLDEVNRADRIALIYPAPPSGDVAASLLGSVSTDRQALASLLGRNRAAVLEALIDSLGTGELAQTLGVSAAAVSQHTAVLRAAGLITTVRHRNTVAHCVTALGLALLDVEDGAAPERGLPFPRVVNDR